MTCTRRSKGSERIGAPCPDCGHTNIAHPGVGNPSLTECAICSMLAATEGPDEAEDWRLYALLPRSKYRVVRTSEGMAVYGRGDESFT